MRDDNLRFEILTRQHNRDAFSCGEPALDDYLKKHARANASLGIATVCVLNDPDENQIAGFFSLAAGSLNVYDLPPSLSSKLPSYPVPVMLLARLTVDSAYQGRGLGGDLLLEALKIIHDLSDRSGIYAAIVDAKHDAARAFYEHFGFEQLPGEPYRLFLRVTAIRTLFPNS